MGMMPENSVLIGVDSTRTQNNNNQQTDINHSRQTIFDRESIHM